jgi:hypothetical protein
MRTIKRLSAALAVAALPLLGLALPASASSFDCVTSDACGTLHSTIDYNGGTAIAMDAKHKNSHEMVIGYPDLILDSATSYVKVQHTSTTLADTAISVSDVRASCTEVAQPAPVETTALIVRSSVSGDCDGAIGGNVSVSGSDSLLQFVISSPDSAGVTGVTASWVLPSGLSPTGPAGPTVVSATTDESTESVGLGTAVAGDYGDQSVTLVATSPTEVYTLVFTFTLHVETARIAGDTFYTLVYAPDGDYTSQCVTDVGDGELALRPCTLGREASQQFLALADGTGTPQVIGNTDTRSFALENVLSGHFMEDTSGSNPLVPQPDSSDNRQLDVNGPASVLWTWGT